LTHIAEASLCRQSIAPVQTTKNETNNTYIKTQKRNRTKQSQITKQSPGCVRLLRRPVRKQSRPYSCSPGARMGPISTGECACLNFGQQLLWPNTNYESIPPPISRSIYIYKYQIYISKYLKRFCTLISAYGGVLQELVFGHLLFIMYTRPTPDGAFISALFLNSHLNDNPLFAFFPPTLDSSITCSFETTAKHLTFNSSKLNLV